MRQLGRDGDGILQGRLVFRIFDVIAMEARKRGMAQSRSWRGLKSNCRQSGCRKKKMAQGSKQGMMSWIEDSEAGAGEMQDSGRRGR